MVKYAGSEAACQINERQYRKKCLRTLDVFSAGGTAMQVLSLKTTQYERSVIPRVPRRHERPPLKARFRLNLTTEIGFMTT